MCCGGVTIRWFKSCSETDELAWLVCVVYGFLPSPDADGKKFGILASSKQKQEREKERGKEMLLYEKIFLGLDFEFPGTQKVRF